MINNILMICHYCLDYTTPSRSDMRKHYLRKNKCKCFTTISYEDAKNLTFNKNFIFTFNPKNLSKSDFSFITTYYNNNQNTIHKNFKNEVINTSENLIENNTTSNEILSSTYSIQNETNNIIEDQTNNIIEDQTNKEISDNEHFNKLYFNQEKNKYVCDKCLSEFTRKFNLVNHMINEKRCQYKKKINTLIKKSEELSQIKKEKEAKENAQFTQHVIQNIKNQNIGTQNININNNNNNTQNNNYNISMRDFVHENYDLTHIKDTYYEKKDFFTYPNLLRVIMENEKNRNILFSDGQAIIYSDNELNRMSSDKAGYLVLDKLSHSADQLLYRQPDDVRQFYSYINKYYHVIKGHYKHDTIFKDYDVNDQRFVYTASSNMFRSRDKYLSKIVSTVNHFSDDIRQNMNIEGHQIKDIPLINPSIEDFASAKMRYRDLKDKD